MIVNAGRAVISARLYGTGSAAFVSIGMGTGVTAATATDTALQTGVTASGSADSGVHVLAAPTASSVTTTVTNDTAQFQGTVSITSTIAVTEAGLFNATTNGTMLCHDVFSAVNVVNGDSIQFTYQIKNA